MDQGTIKSGEIAGFYDDYADRQQRTGTNLRHYYLFHRLKKAGLKKHHRVLEVGCGIGTLTRLIHRYVKRGRVVGVDISERSIAFARKRFGDAPRIEFMVSNMQDFSYPDTFDFIVLPDVLEHIPVEQHEHLFALLRAHMHDDSVIFINIPHPQFIEYFREHSPEKLQIVDQALYADILASNCQKNNLVLLYYLPYSLYHKEHDYVEVAITIRKDLHHISPVSRNYIIIRKWWYRIKC